MIVSHPRRSEVLSRVKIDRRESIFIRSSLSILHSNETFSISTRMGVTRTVSQSVHRLPPHQRQPEVSWHQSPDCGHHNQHCFSEKWYSEPSSELTHIMVVAMRAILVALLIIRHVLSECFLTFLACKGHLSRFHQLMILRLRMTLGTVEPLLATRRSYRYLCVQNMFATRCECFTDRRNNRRGAGAETHHIVK